MTATPKTPHYLHGRYWLHLPVFKQGDDLSSHLSSEPSIKEAFEAMASQYDEAAARCRRMAGVAAECPELEVEASTHHIGVSGSSGRLESLVTDGLLSIEDDEEERESLRELLTEQLWSQKDDGDQFSVDDIVRDFAKLDTELVGLNPAWVREVFDELVEDGCLQRLGEDRYEVTPDEE